MKLDDDQLRALGRVTAASGGLEWTVSAMAGVFVRDFGVARVAFADVGIQAVLQKLVAMARLAVEDKQLRDDVTGFVGRARTAVRRRNAVTHAAWAQGDDVPAGEPATGFSYSARSGELRFNTGSWSAEDLDAIADDLDSADIEGKALLLRLIETFPPGTVIDTG